MSIGNKLRFDVFKRDSFTCQYCGSFPPSVVLEVDHIQPKSKGGKDDLNNLITSCFECNRGKRNYLLDQVPNTLITNIEQIKEKEKQYSEYRKLLKKIEKRINKEVDSVEWAFQIKYPDLSFTEVFRKNTVKKFIDKLGVDVVRDAMFSAVDKCNDETNTTKYFCGICWNKIRENER